MPGQRGLRVLPVVSQAARGPEVFLVLLVLHCEVAMGFALMLPNKMFAT